MEMMLVMLLIKKCFGPKANYISCKRVEVVIGIWSSLSFILVLTSRLVQLREVFTNLNFFLIGECTDHRFQTSLEGARNGCRLIVDVNSNRGYLKRAFICKVPCTYANIE